MTPWLQSEFGQQAVAIALVDRQQVKYHLHGLADVALQTAVTKNTRFEIGSISKPLTALAALGLVQGGRWQLQQPVAALTALSQLKKHQYSLADLLTHRSGLSRLPANMPLYNAVNPYAGYTEAALLDAAASADLDPNGFSYSNFGYGLLGVLIAHQLQQPYTAVMRQHVFTPLNMTTAAVQCSGSQLADLATGYAINDVAVAHWQFDSMAGAGAVVASVEDMAAMLQTIFAAGEDNAIIKRWLEPITTDNGVAMTPGWMLENDIRWHAGQTGGFSSFVGFDPASKLGIVILSNVAVPATAAGFTLLQQWRAAQQQE